MKENIKKFSYALIGTTIIATVALVLLKILKTIIILL